MAGREVKFVDGYADLIAHAGNSWAWIELELHWMIWALLEVNPMVGACVTSQMYTFNAKLDGLVSLMNVRNVAAPLVKLVNKFGEDARSAQEARNRLAHDVWLTDNYDLSAMGRTTLNAKKTLDFKTVSVSLAQLKIEAERIAKAREAITSIRMQLIAAIPTLPKIPPEAPHPLSDVR